MIKVKFKGKWFDLKKSEYTNNNRVALILGKEKGFHFENHYVATVNMLDVDLRKDEVIIKDYSENEGIYNALLEANIIYVSKVTIQTEFVDFLICKLIP